MVVMSSSPLEKILLVGKSAITRELVESVIFSQPHWQSASIHDVASIRRAQNELSVAHFQITLVDCDSFNESALELLIQLKATAKKVPLLLINKAGQEKTAIACLKNGASHYLIKEKNWIAKLPFVIESVLEEVAQQEAVRKKMGLLTLQNEQLKSSSLLDDSNLFYTEKHFHSLLNRELRRAHRYELELTCLLLDIKGSSEKISKESEPQLYEELALLLKATIRASDIWARVSKDRFLAFFPHTSTKQAKSAIRRISTEIKGTPMPLKTSWGLASASKQKSMHGEELLKMAETSLGAM